MPTVFLFADSNLFLHYKPLLDSAPIHLSIVPETNAVRLTSRVPIAYLAIERRLKAFID